MDEEEQLAFYLRYASALEEPLDPSLCRTI